MDQGQPQQQQNLAQALVNPISLKKFFFLTIFLFIQQNMAAMHQQVLGILALQAQPAPVAHHPAPIVAHQPAPAAILAHQPAPAAFVAHQPAPAHHLPMINPVRVT